MIYDVNVRKWPHDLFIKYKIRVVVVMLLADFLFQAYNEVN